MKSSGNSPKPLRAGLAGCGGISHWTYNHAVSANEFVITAIQDIDEKTLSAFSEKYNIPRCHSGFEDLLTEDLDFIIINSPNHVHLEQVTLAAGAGIPVLVQKPITRNLDEARLMIKVVSENQIKAGITLAEISDPLNHQIREMISAGFIGSPCLVHTCNAHDFYLEAPPDTGNWRRDSAKVGGGAFIQLAVHHTNLISWLFKSTITKVSAFGVKKHTVFEDETSSAIATYSNGVIASFSASWATTGEHFTIHGTGGYIHKFTDSLVIKGKQDFDGEMFSYSCSEGEKTIALSSLKDASEQLEKKYEIHNRFARWIAIDEPFPCPLATGLEDMKVIEAVHRSLGSGQTVKIESMRDEE